LIRRVVNFIRSRLSSEKIQQYLEYITILKIVYKKDPCCVTPAGAQSRRERIRHRDERDEGD
jgi:hypothetical protein